MFTNEFLKIPNLGTFQDYNGMFLVDICSDGFHKVGENGIEAIVSTGDKKIELICYESFTVAYVKSELGYPAYYPILSVDGTQPVQAVLMDLDGTSVKSEPFWIYIIQRSVQSLLNNPHFEFEESDIPFVSGHSVSEHLQYCINKYCPYADLSIAKQYYFEHTEREMTFIMEGRGKDNAFVPAAGLKDFLLYLKSRNIKIGLVTSGLYSKAYPEILGAFQSLNMGKPEDFYDCIITAGQRLVKGSCGTLGELEAKPHPWLYAETYNVGLNIPFAHRGSVIGIEDSGAGVCSVRLANLFTIGVSGGNIISSGTKNFCNAFIKQFESVVEMIDSRM